MNLVNIAKGWYAYLKAEPETRKLMQERLAICDGCPNKVQVSPAGEAVAYLFNDVNNLFKCGLCQCPLGTLASVNKPLCKAQKWPQ